MDAITNYGCTPVTPHSTNDVTLLDRVDKHFVSRPYL